MRLLLVMLWILNDGIRIILHWDLDFLFIKLMSWQTYNTTICLVLIQRSIPSQRLQLLPRHIVSRLSLSFMAVDCFLSELITPPGRELQKKFFYISRMLFSTSLIQWKTIVWSLPTLFWIMTIIIYVISEVSGMECQWQHKPPPSLPNTSHVGVRIAAL